MPSFIRDNEKIFFAHIPKCGGTSVKKLLTDNNWEHLPAEEGGIPHTPRIYWEDFPAIQECEFKFTLVRNPIDRIVSHCNMWMSTNGDLYMERLYKILKMQTNGVEHEYNWVILNYIDLVFSELGISYPKDIILKPEELQKSFMKLTTLISEDRNANMIHRHRVLAAAWEEISGIKYSSSSLENFLYSFLKHKFHKINHGGGNPTPSRLYIDPTVEVFKLEEKENLLERLLEKNIINQESYKRGLSVENKKLYSLSKKESFSLSEFSSSFQNVFLFLYGDDYSLFDYKFSD